jgi:hypothetical protein
MIVPFEDSVTGTTIYINPDDVVTVRPDPAHLDSISIVKLRDGEAFRVEGDHQAVADKLTRSP